MSDSLWHRYKEAINLKKDLREIYIRPHARFSTLDGARAITVSLMVMFHVLFGVVVLLQPNLENLDNFIINFPRYLGWLFHSQGSDPLFLMCGLLVAYTLYREHDRTGGINIKRFYRRRLMRVLPTFLLALLLYFPTDKDNIEYLLSNLVFLSNYFPDQRRIVPVGWSLEVQMIFYLLLPFLILVMYKFPYRIWIMVGLFIASIVWRYYIVARNPEIWQTPFYQILYDSDFGSLLANELYYDLDVRIGAFFLGMLVAYIHDYHGDALQAFFKRHLLVNLFVVILGAVLLACSLSLPLENKYHPIYENFNPMITFWFLVIDRYVYALGLALLLLVALCPAGAGWFVHWILSWRIWHPIAQLIFPIYLFHFIFIVLGAAITFQTTDRDAITTVETWQVFSIFFWAMLLTIAFSTLVHLFVEKPFLNMREPARRKEALQLGEAP